MTPDDIRKNREAGTPGPWSIAFDEVTRIKDSSFNTLASVTYTHLHGRRSADEVEANARRIARLPELEDAYLAAVEEIEQLRSELRETVERLWEN